MNRLRGLGCIAGISVLLAAGAYGQLGNLGTTVDDAKKTDLFGFFHLKETTRDTGPVNVVHYRPSGADFHDLAEVDLSLTGESITGSQLVLARSFLSGMNGVFAKDLMVSYLKTVLTAGDLAVLKPLLAQANVPLLGGEAGAFSCTTPAGLAQMPDTSLTFNCDASTNLLTFKVARKTAH